MKVLDALILMLSYDHWFFHRLKSIGKKNAFQNLQTSILICIQYRRSTFQRKSVSSKSLSKRTVVHAPLKDLVTQRLQSEVSTRVAIFRQEFDTGTFQQATQCCQRYGFGTGKG